MGGNSREPEITTTSPEPLTQEIPGETANGGLDQRLALLAELKAGGNFSGHLVHGDDRLRLLRSGAQLVHVLGQTVSFFATKRRFESCPVRQAESGRLLADERLGGATGEVAQVPRSSQLVKGRLEHVGADSRHRKGRKQE